jgi:hypothetical protein
MAIDRPFSDLAGVPEVAHLVSIRAPPTAPAAVPSIGIALAEDGGAGQPGHCGDQATEDPTPRAIHS